jgi:hypothetical protein
MVKAIKLVYLLRDFMFLFKVTRNRGVVSTWVCPLGALRLTAICVTLMGVDA